MEAKKDYFGGIKAKQHIVSALMQGPEEDYAKGEAVARTIWAPVMRPHRVTVEQLAMLEPALAETMCASLIKRGSFLASPTTTTSFVRTT